MKVKVEDPLGYVLLGGFGKVPNGIYEKGDFPKKKWDRLVYDAKHPEIPTIFIMTSTPIRVSKSSSGGDD